MSSIEDPLYLTQNVVCPYVSGVRIRLDFVDQGSAVVLNGINCQNKVRGDRNCHDSCSRGLCRCFEEYSSLGLADLRV